MTFDDEFEPRLGRIRDQGGKRARKYLHQVIAATNLARGGAAIGARRRGFSGVRIGRAAGVGRMLSRRDHYAAFRMRRVIIKSRIVRLAEKGAGGARAHLRYVQRDGVTRQGEPGKLYGADSDSVDGKKFLERSDGDRHQFRFIVSAEDGADYDDLKPLTRRLMTRIEADLGTHLDWVAVDHFNTGHPHSHIVVRGKDDRGKDLIIARDYISHGMRERACELVDLDLGPRSDRDIERRLRADIGQERLTGLDRDLIRTADGENVVNAGGRSTIDQTIRIARLRKLEQMELAASLGALRWRLAPGLADTLRRIGERDDIIRTMQRAYASRPSPPGLIDQVIYEPARAGGGTLVGRVAARGLSDELDDRHYLIVEATDGRSHYVDIGKGETVDAVADGAIVRIAPVTAGAHAVDRTVAAVAAANDGHYDIDAHLRHDSAATDAFAQTHVRRLEAMRRLTGGVERGPDGRWIIAVDHVARAEAYEAARAKDRPVTVEILSPLPLERLIEADAATWLDTELVAAAPTPLRDAAFGHDASTAQARRRQWLVAEGIAGERDGAIDYPPGMIDALRRRELLRVAAQVSRELDMPFDEGRRGALIEGIYRRPVDTLGGRYALIEKARDFTLVPWHPVLDRHVGERVSGIARGDTISWSVGRGRGGPTID
ncbi:DUF3363 domain-containing protein [Sphingomonas koreensis]|nr:DUF3363 domain-containing protein [Sphingomonas koreensis]